MARRQDKAPPQDRRPAPPRRPTAADFAALQREAGTPDDVGHFFKREDWLAALATFLFSALVFFYYMAPEVTLEDSGELVTGAFTFGVPHPPGYPLWAFLGFIWSHFVVPFGNPAWRICLMSVATGGLTVATMTLMMTRSTRVLLHSVPWSEAVDEGLQHWIALMVGISTALLFGFNRGVWLWACVSEMRVLNQLSFVLLSCTFMAWMIQPQRRFFLYATLLLFGLSMTNHQTVVVMAAPFIVGTLAVGWHHYLAVKDEATRLGIGAFRTLLTSLATFWELSGATLLSAAVGFALFAWLRTPTFHDMFQDTYWYPALAALAGSVAIIVIGAVSRCWRPRLTLSYAALYLAGCSFYLYMPIASSTNPPMNWGYASTKEGFLHAITRGQYEKLQVADFFSPQFFIKIRVFLAALVSQYSLLLTLVGLATLVMAAVWLSGNVKKYSWILVVWAASFFALLGSMLLLIWWHASPDESRWLALFWAAFGSAALCLLIGAFMSLKRPGGSWMVFAWVAFLAASLGLLTIINPKLDKQEQEITIKFFAPAHGFFAMLIGYGIATALGLLARWRKDALFRKLLGVACACLLFLPLISFQRNWSLCNLRGHDFGYKFGYLMFNPGGGYPPMDRDAVLYGGTDPGRFVPTYMIFCESRVPPKDRFFDHSFDRSDVYIITQNALADNTYMNYIRDHYDFTRPNGDDPNTTASYPFLRRGVFQWAWTHLHRDRTYPPAPIYIPAAADSSMAFTKYMQDVQAGRIPASADVKIENGRISVQGVGGVMTINGILAQWIFDRNKNKHSFYIEESYPILWMYPYLKPAGIIMKIEKDTLPPPQEAPAVWSEIVARDRAYWDKLTAEFMARNDFRRNSDAQKSFSKLRSAIGGLYAYRGMAAESEYAFRQALELCPESPEANFRLADQLMQQHRFAEARGLMETYLKFDEYNGSARGFLDSIRRVETNETRRVELEKQFQQGRVDIGSALELASIYQQLNMDAPFRSLAKSILETTNIPPDVYRVVARMHQTSGQWDLACAALKRYLGIEPRNFAVRIDLGFAQLALNQPAEALNSFKQAVETGGAQARAALQKDPRFEPLRQQPEFRALVPDAAPIRLPLLDSGSPIGIPTAP